MSGIAIGEWVQGSSSPDFDLERNGAVGVLVYVCEGDPTMHGGRRLYAIGRREDDRNPFGTYPFVKRITKAESRRIVQAWRELERGRYVRDIASFGEQIRAFLREETHRQRASKH